MTDLSSSQKKKPLYTIWDVTISMWHSRPGHPSLHIFHKFLSVLNISLPEKHLCSFSCNSCNINKSHKLPSSKSSINSSSLLDIIFSDIWTSPFHLLMVFTTMLFLLTIAQSISSFTRYVEKLDVHSTFVTFKQLVENYFTTTIKTLYTDNGSGFLALRSPFSQPMV